MIDFVDFRHGKVSFPVFRGADFAFNRIARA